MTIKEIKFDPPLINPRVSDLEAAMMKSPTHELSVGNHDLTPEGYRDSYAVEVTDPGNGDNEGVLKITRKGGREINIFSASDQMLIRKSTTRSEKVLYLGPGTPPYGLSRPMALDNPNHSGLKVDGVVFYEPKK